MSVIFLRLSRRGSGSAWAAGSRRFSRRWSQHIRGPAASAGQATVMGAEDLMGAW